MMRFAPLLLCLAATFQPATLAQSASAQTRKETPMQHAAGEFTVSMKPQATAPAEGLSRFLMDKAIHGDMEATSKGEMLAGGDYSKGAAGYVAIELVTGTLAGRHGSFALMHMATLDSTGPQMTVKIVPGSGTGELTGISGTFTIDPSGGKHRWMLDYTLP